MKKQHIETQCCHAGYTPQKDGDPRALPIWQSTTFVYDDFETMADIFNLKVAMPFYSRLGNPTCDALEAKITALEGGFAAMATSSGQAASMVSVLNVAKAGDHIISCSEIYGGTYNLFAVTMKKLGIEFTFVDRTMTFEQIDALVRPNTKAIFGETLANPACYVLDFEKIARVAKKHKILFIVDNTLATPILCRPFEHGADVVVHSSTKYLDGHAVAVGGLIVDSGNFEFEGNERYKDLYTPDESYHGLNYVKDAGKLAYILKARGQYMRDMGVCQSPMNAFLTHLGMETLHLRMARTSENGLKVATMLSQNKKVEFVRYAALPNGEDYPLFEKYLDGGAAGMICFGVKGGRQEAKNLIQNLKLVRNLTHVADLRSCVLHPASATHRQLSDEALRACGVPPNLIRLSKGIENGEEIVEDIRQAIEKA